MERRTLDPKQDVVFKLLFANERNQEVLIAFLTAMLKPARPIAGVTVLNPETTKESVRTRGAVLDVRVRLEDRTQVDLEMQTTSQSFFAERGLYYWARMYGSQLETGDKYPALRPVVSIFILNFDALKTGRYHSTFQLQEIHGHQTLTDDLAMHFLELPNIPPRHSSRGVDEADVYWGRFFSAKTDQQLEDLVMSNPQLKPAKAALDRLSDDPEARQLAEDRAFAIWNYEEGMRRSALEGKAEGKAEGLRAAVMRFCQALGVELTDARVQQLGQPGVDLQAILDEVVLRRRWPS